MFGEDGNDVFVRQTLAGGATITYVTNPHFVCDDGVQIWADSAVAYSATSMSHLMGAVRYVDRSRELRADEARYFSNVGRLQAEGRVRVRDFEEGSLIEDGDLVYLRRTAYRPDESMVVTVGADGVRPRATIYPAPAAERAPVPDIDTLPVAGDSAAASTAPKSGAAITTAARSRAGWVPMRRRSRPLAFGSASDRGTSPGWCTRSASSGAPRWSAWTCVVTCARTETCVGAPSLSRVSCRALASRSTTSIRSSAGLTPSTASPQP